MFAHPFSRRLVVTACGAGLLLSWLLMQSAGAAPDVTRTVGGTIARTVVGRFASKIRQHANKSGVRVPRYHLIDMGTLGGGSTSARGINSAGHVVGDSTLPGDTATHAFLYDGTMHDLGTLGGTHSLAYAVNSAGMVVGYSYTTDDAAVHAFLHDGTMRDLGTLGGPRSFASAINGAGQVVGYSHKIGDTAYHAFLYDGTLHELGTLGGTASAAYGIDSAGRVVGYSNVAGNASTPAFLYDGVMHVLGTLGGTMDVAMGINDSGQVAGYGFTTGNAATHAFFYDGTMHDLGTLGGRYSVAYGLNSTGQVVGTDLNLNGQFHGFLYMNGTMYDLDDLIAPRPGLNRLGDATAINDSGEIACGRFKMVPNALPVPVPDTYDVRKNTTLTVPASTGLLQNDTDSDAATFGQTLTVIKVSDPAHGTLTAFGTDGSFAYIPSSGYTGTDSFTYKTNDGLESSALVATVTLSVENTAPGAPSSLSISPSPAYCTSSLLATAGGSNDPDPGDVVSYKYEWSQSGGEWGYTSTDGKLTGATLTKGDVWRVRACATDGALDSGWTDPVQVTIANTPPPTPPSVTIVPTTPTTLSDLRGRAQAPVEADGDSLTYRYQWSNSPDGATWSDWGNTGAILSNSLTTKGEYWRVRCRCFDGTVWGGWQISAPVQIVNRQPTKPTTLRILPAAPTTFHKLSANAGGSTDADDDAITYHYQWSKSTDDGATWSAWYVPGRVVPATLTEIGEIWRVRARARDRETFGPWSAPVSVTIAGAPVTAAALTMAAAAVPIRAAGVQVSLSLSTAASVHVNVHNLAGRVISTLPEAQLPSGISSLNWSGRTNSGSLAPAGTYLIRLTARTAHGATTEAVTKVWLKR